MNLGQLTKRDATLQLLDWLNKRFPGIKSEVIKKVQGNYRLGQTDNTLWDAFNYTPTADIAAPQADDSAWYDKLVDAAAQIVPVYYNYKTQAKIVDAQIERARAGQSPLDARAYAAPPIVVEHAVAPGAISSGLSQEDKNMLWIGAAAIGAFLLLRGQNA